MRQRERELPRKSMRRKQKSLENTSDETQVMHTVPEKSGYRVLAVTACPTGIAHTYMAAESLEIKRKKWASRLKLRPMVPVVRKNVLTAQEIEACDCIIIAADKDVKMARFDGKPVIMTKVANGISKAEELLNEATSGNVKIYHHAGGEDEEGQVADESLGRKIYKSLMNGVSHMLPFVIGGGILIALAFLLDDYSIDPSNFGKNTPLAAYLKTIGEQAFGMMLPILAGFIAMSIADRPGLAVGLVAGLIGGLLTIEFGIPGWGGFLFAIVAGSALAAVCGYLYALMLNRLKGSEMSVTTYVGFFHRIFNVYCMAGTAV